MKGLICAGGTATRLEELTRVTNKHLLPVGRWPMVYYPLQLLQRVGVHEVLLVTGKQHAGDFIDLLGDGRVKLALDRRAAVRPRSHLQGAGRAGRDRAGRRHGARLRPRRAARRLPRRQHLRERAGRRDRRLGGRRARVREGGGRPGELRRRRLRRGRAASPTSSRRPGVVDMRYADAAVERRGRGPLLLPAGRVRDHRLAASRRPRRARDHRRQPRLRPARRSSRCAASRAGGTTAASTGPTSPTSAGRSRRPGSTSDRRALPARAARGRARLVLPSSPARARCRSRSGRRTSPGRGRA